MRPIVVDSTQCHLWTDALHIRQLAHEARNKWDRGTYVRMTVATAWTAMEVTAQELLGAKDIGYSFKANMDRAVGNAGLPALDWSRGIWQKVRELQERRKSYVHRYDSLDDLFPEATVADDAIETVRLAIASLSKATGREPPTWLDLNEAAGWHGRSNLGLATITTAHHGASFDGPHALPPEIRSR